MYICIRHVLTDDPESETSLGIHNVHQIDRDISTQVKTQSTHMSLGTQTNEYIYTDG